MTDDDNDHNANDVGLAAVPWGHPQRFILVIANPSAPPRAFAGAIRCSSLQHIYTDMPCASNCSSKRHRMEFVRNPQTDWCAPERASGIRIRDCAGSISNCVPRRPELSATDVTAKSSFARLYLGSFWETIANICHQALGAHTPTVPVVAISWFSWNNFSSSGPSNFLQVSARLDR